MHGSVGRAVPHRAVAEARARVARAPAVRARVARALEVRALAAIQGDRAPEASVQQARVRAARAQEVKARAVRAREAASFSVGASPAPRRGRPRLLHRHARKHQRQRHGRNPAAATRCSGSSRCNALRRLPRQLPGLAARANSSVGARDGTRKLRKPSSPWSAPRAPRPLRFSRRRERHAPSHESRNS